MTTQRDIEELLESYHGSAAIRGLLDFFRKNPKVQETVESLAKCLRREEIEVKLCLNELVKRNILARETRKEKVFYTFIATPDVKVWIARSLKTEEIKRGKLQLSTERFRKRVRWGR